MDYFEELKDTNCPACPAPTQEACKQYSKYFFERNIDQCPKCFNDDCEIKNYDYS